MPRKVIRGTGITAYETVVYDQEGDLPRDWGDSWNRAIDEGGGIFGAVSLQAARTCEHILANAPDETPLEDSPEAFAQYISKCIAVAKHEIEKDNADLAARLAFSAGVKWAQANMKWAWEADALRGEKVAGGEKNAAAKTNARHDALREKRFARMGELVPGIGVDTAAAHCEAEGLGSREAIKKQWNRHRPTKKKGTPISLSRK